jgi:hypothetical protein
MKPLFFFLLFSNIVYFLWQYQREGLEKNFVWTEQTEKQILLLTEEQKYDATIDEKKPPKF